MPKTGFKNNQTVPEFFDLELHLICNTRATGGVTAAQLKFIKSCNVTVSEKASRRECKPVLPSLNVVPTILFPCFVFSSLLIHF